MAGRSKPQKVFSVEEPSLELQRQFVESTTFNDEKKKWNNNFQFIRSQLFNKKLFILAMASIFLLLAVAGGLMGFFIYKNKKMTENNGRMEMKLNDRLRKIDIKRKNGELSVCLRHAVSSQQFFFLYKFE